MMPPTPRNMQGPEKFHSVIVNGLSARRVNATRVGGSWSESTGFVLPTFAGSDQLFSRKRGWST